MISLTTVQVVHGTERRSDAQNEFGGFLAELGYRAVAVDIISALPAVESDAMAVIRFCFGGLCVLDLARHGSGLEAVGSFHGVLTPPHADVILMGRRKRLLERVRFGEIAGLPRLNRTVLGEVVLHDR